MDVAKERLVGSSSNPGPNSNSLYSGLISTGRKTQKVVKASSTAPVITTHTERPRSAHNEDESSLKNKVNSGNSLLGIEDAFDKAISLPNSPVSKELPFHMETKKHETKKAQRRHHTHHLFDGILHTISGGTNEESKAKHVDQHQIDQNTSSELSVESCESPSVVGSEIDRSHQNESQEPDSKDNVSGTPVGLIRRWSETTSSPTTKSGQSKQPKVTSISRLTIIHG